MAEMLKKLLFLLIPILLQTCTMRPLHAQTTVIERPDCFLPVGPFTAAGSTTPFDNRNAGCTFWVFAYNSFGFTVESIVVQTAPNATGGIPGAWSTFTAATGSNPNTATTSATSTFGGGTSYFPWVRVTLSSKTGTGSITGVLYGWRSPSAVTAIISGVVTVVGNKSNNAVVPGSTNLGVLPCLANAAAPSWTEGFQVVCSADLAGNQRVKVSGETVAGAAVPLRLGNTGGEVIQTVGVAQVDANSNTPNIARSVNESGGALSAYFDRIMPFMFNGSTWDRQYICASRALVTLTDATLTALVPVSGSTIVHVCHVHATTSGGAETFSLVQGTGVACAGSPVTIDSYVGTLAFSTDFIDGGLRTSASNGLCVSQSGAAQTAAVVVTYAQF